VTEATLDAARLRFRPILMTSLTFVLGVAPMVIATGAGAASRRALGTAVFGGMVATLTVGLVFMPVLYGLVQRSADRLARRRRKGAQEVAQ
jgi:HAE1 family hydrophobic/amphiphilic exporter-1